MNLAPGLTRYDYYRGPKPVGDLWTARRDALTMRCAVSTHRLGWELRLTAGAGFQRTQVCKVEAEVFSVGAAWLDEARRQGWQPEPDSAPAVGPPDDPAQPA